MLISQLPRLLAVNPKEQVRKKPSTASSQLFAFGKRPFLFKYPGLGAGNSCDGFTFIFANQAILVIAVEAEDLLALDTV